MKRFWIIPINAGGLFLIASLLIYVGAARISTKAESDTRSANVLEQQALLKMGRKMIKAGDFEGALEKFNEALNPKYIKTYHDKTQAISSKTDLYVLWGKYTDALKEYDWIFERTPDHQYSVAKQKEILALIEWEESKDNKVIYDYISFLKEHFREQIPPVAYIGYHTTVISTILRLYDTIGDHDAGITYIDEIMSFFRTRKKDREEDFEIYDRVKTVENADACLQVGPKENPNWHACKLIREYLLIRETFEQDKSDGAKGRATKALVQSDYFPW